MDPDICFFEPLWPRVLDMIKNKDGSRIASVSVMLKCGKEDMQACVDKWEQRVTALAGPVENIHSSFNETALSLLIKHVSGTITSIFADRADDGECISFEIVSADSLYIWDEDAHALSRISSGGRCGIIYRHDISIGGKGESGS